MTGTGDAGVVAGLPRRQLAPTVALGALATVAWAALMAWSASPQGRYLDHGALDDGALHGPALVGVLTLAWVLMIAAMMLPTTQPLLAAFRIVVRRRARPGRLVALVLTGYVAAWTVVGLAMIGGDAALHAVVDRASWLHERPWLITAAVLSAAGAYQFSSLKYRCLDLCRSPRMFLMQRWRGANDRRQAFEIGVAHGRTCVGCCWPLMAVMFAVGSGSIAWMLGLGSLMAVEKNLPVGRWLSTAVGVALFAGAAAVAASGIS